MEYRLIPPGTISIYIHVPFCVRKCGYCDFFSIADADDFTISHTIASILHQLVYYYTQLAAPRVTSLYIGGGTPSSIGLSATRMLLSGISRIIGADNLNADDFEYTIEANPESITDDLLGVYKSAGINRLSVGIQTFSRKYYSLIGRYGSPEIAREALELLRKHWTGRLNLDLMTAFPGQSPEEGTTDVEELLSYSPDHVSLYTLTVEPGTPLCNDLKEGKISAAGDDAVDVWEIQI